MYQVASWDVLPPLFPEPSPGFQAKYIWDWSATIYPSANTGLKEQAQRSLSAPSISSLPFSSSYKPKKMWLPSDPCRCPRADWSKLGYSGKCPCPWHRVEWAGFWCLILLVFPSSGSIFRWEASPMVQDMPRAWGQSCHKLLSPQYNSMIPSTFLFQTVHFTGVMNGNVISGKELGHNPSIFGLIGAQSYPHLLHHYDPGWLLKNCTSHIF